MASYTVRPGDTLGKIARQLYGNAAHYTLIVRANRIPDPDRLAVGQKLVIPDLSPAGDGQTALGPGQPPEAPQIPHIQLSLQRLEPLHSAVRTRGRALITACAEAGLAILITQGLRSWKEQDALYRKGRTVPPIGEKYWVTMAKGGQSYHNFGLAFDIVVLNALGKADWNSKHPGWAAAGELGATLGLEWGGTWKKRKDLPHFQYTGGISLHDCCELYPAGLSEVWSRVL
jgi:peptidoglycan L-alanyl-D-glutamate endopeptidase CwlK